MQDSYPIPAPRMRERKFETKSVYMTSLENKLFPANFVVLKLKLALLVMVSFGCILQ